MGDSTFLIIEERKFNGTFWLKEAGQLYELQELVVIRCRPGAESLDAQWCYSTGETKHIPHRDSGLLHGSTELCF